MQQTFSFLADRDIPCSESIFAGMGRVRFFGGADPRVCQEHLAVADVLAVRSATRIDHALLDLCGNIKVIATPVIGTDHIDRTAVDAASERLGWPVSVINAPGSTAESVADWTLAAIFNSVDSIPSRVGVIGAGRCGTAVIRRLEMLGIDTVVCDPPRSAAEPGFSGVGMDDLLDCDVLTAHVPLTRPGESKWPTAGLLSVDFCSRFASAGKARKLVVNCSRGPVLDEAVFEHPVDRRPLFALDVFENEPRPSVRVVAGCRVCTPHVAGSGRIGRINAAEMVRRGVADVLDLEPGPMPRNIQMDPVRETLPVDGNTARNARDFAEFAGKLAFLGGVSISEAFKDAWIESDPDARETLFYRFRALGTRTEPVWVLR